MNSIEVSNVTIGYNRHPLLRNISFTLSANELVYITGGNGSGKSTLIKVIMGLLPVQSGEIKIHGELLSQKVVSRHIGYVPQSLTIDKTIPITVEEVIDLECSLSHECSLSIRDHLSAFRADHLMNKRINNLSGGELQRVLIARALVSNPDILFLDEPTNNLDKETRVFLDSVITEIYSQKQRTVIIVTHDHSLSHTEKTRTKSIHIEDEGIIVNHANE